MKDTQTFPASLCLAAVFLFGRRLRVRRARWREGISASVGAAVAYVFIHPPPDLSKASGAFAAGGPASADVLPPLSAPA